MSCCLLFVMGKSDSGAVLRSEPSHRVMTKWYGENGRRFSVCEATVTAPVVLRMTAETDGKDKKLILKTENLAVTAYTKGRILYHCSDTGKALLGKRTTVITADDIKKGKDVYLQLAPAAQQTGKMLQPVYLADNNDYLFTVLARSARTHLLLGVLAAAMLICLAVVAVFFRQARNCRAAYRKSKPILCLIALSALLFLLLLSKSELFCFLAGCSEGAYLLEHTAYLLLPLPCLAFAVICSGRNAVLTWLEIAVCVYALLRLLLFGIFSVPLDRGIIAAHGLLFCSVAAGIAHTANGIVQKCCHTKQCDSILISRQSQN